MRTRRQAHTWIATRHVATYGRLGFGFWAVERKADGALVGMCGLIKRDTLMEADVGYALMPAFRGQGYASRSRGGVRALRDWTCWACPRCGASPARTNAPHRPPC